MSSDINPILEKKLENAGGYNSVHELFDFTCSGERSVEISLSEYRRLVTNDATRDEQVKKAEKDRYERAQENDRLKKENDALKAELYELKKKLDNANDDARHMRDLATSYAYQCGECGEAE